METMKQSNRVTRVLVELVLIVVGVSIALSADQWAQGRAERARLAGYLTQLEAALVADSIHLDGRIHVIDFRLEVASILEGLAGTQLTESMGCDSVVLSENAAQRTACEGSQPAPLATFVLLASFAAGSPIQFFLNTGPFEDLRASGLTPRLPADLRKTITDYYLTAEDGEEYWSQVNSGLDEMVLGMIPSGWVAQSNSAFEFGAAPSASDRASVANRLLMDEKFVGRVRRQMRRLRIQRAVMGVHNQAVKALQGIRTFRSEL
jgi:hypothetical protein